MSDIPIEISMIPVRGQMSASANAAAQNKSHIVDRYKIINLKSVDDFFPIDGTNTDDKHPFTIGTIGENNMKAFEALTNDKETKEEKYRDFFYSMLITHEECKDHVAILPIPQETGTKIYKEGTMQTLLPDIYDRTKAIFGISSEDSTTSKTSSRKRKGEGDENEVRKVEQSLMIQNDSRPDLVVVQNNSMTIRIGEFKNASKYSKLDGATQCFSYLSCMLYHFRAVHHIPLESVYGFSFCGPQCKGLDNKYAVGLLKLSAPRKLGEKFIFEQFWQTFPIAKPEQGITRLLYYLTKGKPWEIPLESPLKDLKKRLPALFSIPLQYWEDDGSSVTNSGPVRELQRNGTSAIVFKVDYAGMMKLFKGMIDVGTGGQEFQIFVDGVASKIQTLGDEKRYFYVKFQLSETCTIFKEIMINTSKIYQIANGARTERNVVWNDIRNLYIVPPYMDTENNFYCIVMADVMGQSLVSSNINTIISKEKMIELLFGLQSYMDQLIAAELFHGDFLPHNFFFNEAENRIKVIDFDEGCASKNGPVPLRGEATNNTSWDLRLRYPNALVDNCEMYTKVQFAVSVMQLLGRYGQTKELEENAKTFESVLTKIENLEVDNDVSEGIESMYSSIKVLLSTTDNKS